jgi:hypothetical protein
MGAGAGALGTDAADASEFAADLVVFDLVFVVFFAIA